jgi:hypothetical protein
MSLWIFQSIVDVLILNVALMWIVSRKRSKFLEAQVDRLELELGSIKLRLRGLPEANSPQGQYQQTLSDEPSVGFVGLNKTSATMNFAPIQQSTLASSSAPMSSLSEKSPLKSLLKTNPAEAFERANQMLSQGINVKEISKVTGLSLGELQLMNKVGNRTQ